MSIMSFVATPLVTSSPCSPRSGNYHPSIWGDHFIQYASESSEGTDELEMEKQNKILKEEVRKMLVFPTGKPAEKMNLIDAIQRLGVDYHFELEIDDLLQQIHDSYIESGTITTFEEKDDLNALALLFRLLRQHGYRISPAVFEKFKDEQGNFMEELTTDVEGMLSLYEAAHLRVHGEDILDEALIFTTTHLESMADRLDSSLATKVNYSFKHPLRKNYPRLEARHYISFYQHESSHNETLLTFAKLNFNMLQKLHQCEVGNVSKWWKELDFAKKLPFARDRLVECYYWILGVYFEPYYSLARKITTKVICFISVLDDIYDVYGTLEELQLLTTAIERWDITCVDFLPEYMKFFYEALLDIYEDIKQEMTKEGRAFCVKYAKDEMKRLAQAYMVEAEWFNSNYTPTMEEHMSNALVTAAIRTLAATSFIGMGNIATEEVFEWLAKDPKVISASDLIGRLVDDIMTSEHEQKRGHVASAIECYMKQHGVKREEAIDELNKQVISAWKDVNEELLNPTKLANLNRTVDVIYKDFDSYTFSAESTKDRITFLLINPLAL